MEQVFLHFLSTIVAFSSRRNTRGDSDEKMRGGGPKLLCSPYFTIGTVVLLIIVIMKYYSLSSEHDNILLKVNVLQNQMKLTASNMRNLDTSLTRKDEALNECLNEKNNHENKIKSLQSELSEKEVNMENLQTLNTEAKDLVKKLQDDNEKFNQDNNTMMEEMKYLRRRNEELTHNEEECRANEGKINQLQGELNTLKEQAKEFHIRQQQMQQKLDEDNQRQKSMPVGELPNVDPAAVQVIQPALNGTNNNSNIDGALGHNIPILPKGDPNIEKPQPRVHVDAPLVNDEQVRNEIIAEEEAKEQIPTAAAAIDNLVVQNNPKNDDNDIHDFANAVLPPSKDQEVVYKKKTNFGIKDDTKPLLDLSKLKRAQNMGIINEETAVLKEPFDLAEIQKDTNIILDEKKNDVADEPPKEYDEQELPGPQDNRDPEKLLNDPRANDQDADPRILDAVKNGFAKNKGKLRN